MGLVEGRLAKADVSIFIKNITNRDAANHLGQRAKILRDCFAKVRESKLFPFGTLQVFFNTKQERDNALWADVSKFGLTAKVEIYQHMGYKVHIHGLPNELDKNELGEEIEKLSLSVRDWVVKDKINSPKISIILTLDKKRRV